MAHAIALAAAKVMAHAIAFTMACVTALTTAHAIALAMNRIATHATALATAYIKACTMARITELDNLSMDNVLCIRTTNCERHWYSDCYYS